MTEASTNRTMPQKCPQCGAVLPTGTLAGLCPACLLQQGAAADTATHPEAKPFVPPPVEEVARLFPQLEILGFLGKGGMGAVYKARQPALDRLVALKILPAQSVPDPGFAERFTREARALARLSHPSIVAVHEFGQVPASGAGVPPVSPPGVSPGSVPQAGETPAPLPAPSLPYFIMEFVDGVNLRQLQKADRLSPREALQIVPQICDALQYAHDEGVVHRDIKPENVLVDRKGRVKIADFGLAKIMTGRAGSPLPAASGSVTSAGAPGVTRPARELTEAGQVMGTPHYMAPEQVEHPQDVDHRADIYSLGVVFYEMLTGELPLGKFQPPSRKVQVDVRLDEVVLHALEKEPELRYQQASHVKTDVQQIATGVPPPGQAIQQPVGAVGRKAPRGTDAAAFAANETPGVPEPAPSAARAWKIAALAIIAVVVLNCIILVVALRPMLSKPPPAASASAMPAGLVGWWRGEGNALDEVGSNNGVMLNRVGFDQGVVGQAFRFDGIGYVEVPDNPTLRFTDALTVECWARRLKTPEVHILLEKGGDWTGGQTDFEVALNDIYSGGSHFGFSFAGGTRGCAVTPDTSWHHYAVVAVSGQADPILYIDGVPQTITFRSGSATIEFSSSTRPLHIGAQVDRQAGWSYYSSTMVDELAVFKRALSASEILAKVTADQHDKGEPLQRRTAITNAPPRLVQPGSSRRDAPISATPGLVGWWRGERNARDSAGTNNGSLLGKTTFAPGRVGLAFSFDPDSGTVLVPDSPSLRLTNELTIEAWINAHSLSDPVGGYAIVSKLGIASGDNGYQLLLVGDTLQGLFNSPGLSWPSQRIISGPLIRTGAWYHVAFTYDQSAMKLYCNGQVVATSDIGAHPIATSTSDLRISGADDHCYFDGLIDEAAVYNRALSAAEVQAIFAAGQNGKGESGQVGSSSSPPTLAWPLAAARASMPSAGLVSCWRAEGTATDSVGGASGTLYGGVTFAPGKVGQCFAFNGVRGGVKVPDVAALALTHSLSIECWLLVTNPPSVPGMVLFRGDSRGGLDPYYVSVEPHAGTAGVLNFVVCGQANINAYVSAPMPLGAWTHVAATLDDPTGLMTLYTNAVLAAQTNTSTRPLGPLDPTCHPGLGIGNASSPPQPFNYPFRGCINDLSIYSRALSAAEIQTIYSGNQSDKGKTAGLVSWWRPEGHALDEVGENNGVLMSGAGIDAGVVGQAFRFNGSSESYVEVADSPTLRLTNALTFVCWSKRLMTSEVHTLVEKGGAWTGGQTDYESTLNDTYYGGSHFGFAFAGGWRGCAVTPDTEWHHYAIAAVNGQADPILYIDGVPQPITFRGGPATIELAASARPLHIGALIDSATGWFFYSSTLIDAPALFNRALSADEIHAIYTAGKSGKSGLSPYTSPRDRLRGSGREPERNKSGQVILLEQ
jgi:serine/threonine protein kinase